MLRKLLSATGILPQLRSVLKESVRAQVGPIHADTARLTKQVERLSHQVDVLQQSVAALQTGLARAERAERQVSQMRSIQRLNDKQAELVSRLPALLAASDVLTHVRQAIFAAPLQMDPYPHIVVTDVMPPEIYRLLVKAIPPATFFSDRDPIKQNLRVPFESGPTLSCEMWKFMDTVVAREAIRPAVLEVFRQPLVEMWDRVFGADFRSRVEALPQAISGGRVMLRRPGYYLAPHRDPKRTMLTCLMYLAGRHADDTYGTEIYRVRNDRESSITQTYYPEQNGGQCELVKVVPNRPNSMLVFLNSHGAHGARIPADAPADTERHAYQFYLGPEQEALNALIQDLPPERAAMWQSKAS